MVLVGNLNVDPPEVPCLDDESSYVLWIYREHVVAPGMEKRSPSYLQAYFGWECVARVSED